MSREFLMGVLLVIPYNVILHWMLARMGGVQKKLLYICVMGALCELLNLLVAGFLRLDTLNALLQFALFPVSLLIFSKSRLPRCLLASGLCILMMFLTDQSMSALFLAMGGRLLADGQPSMFENPGAYLFMRVLLMVLTVFFAYVFDRLWALTVEKSDDGSVWYFMLFPLSQGLLLYQAGSMTIEAGGTLPDYALTAAFALLCVGADFIMFRVISRVRLQAAAEERADFMAEQLRGEQERDALILRDAEEAAKLRHDMRNQIQAIYALLEGGENELARRHLEGLSDLLPAGRELCENKIVGAILAQNLRLCEQAGIAAEFSCDVPAALPVDSVTLCSLFSNLLDNARAACARSEAEKPFLRLAAGVQRGYFIVRCENSLPKPEKKAARTPRSEHGWGLDIVRDFAARFDGRVEAGPAEDAFRTVVFLHLPDAPA